MDVLVKMFSRATHPFGPLLNMLPLPSNFRSSSRSRSCTGLSTASSASTARPASTAETCCRC